MYFLQVFTQTLFSFCLVFPDIIPISTCEAGRRTTGIVVGKKRCPAGSRKRKKFQRIISALLTVAFSAGYQHITWNVKACAITIHAVQMFNY